MNDPDCSYQWSADGLETAGATGPGYTTVVADEGKTITVTVSFTDDADDAETLTSEPTTAAAAAAPTEPPPAPTNLVAEVNQDGTVTLTWDSPNDDSVTGYQILRRCPSGGEKTFLVYVEDTGAAPPPPTPTPR